MRPRFGLRPRRCQPLTQCPFDLRRFEFHPAYENTVTLSRSCFSPSHPQCSPRSVSYFPREYIGHRRAWLKFYAGIRNQAVSRSKQRGPRVLSISPLSAIIVLLPFSVWCSTIASETCDPPPTALWLVEEVPENSCSLSRERNEGRKSEEDGRAQGLQAPHRPRFKHHRSSRSLSPAPKR